MGSDPDLLDYFLFSFLANIGEIVKDYVRKNASNQLE